MARGNRGSRPTHYIAVTAKVGKGRYEKGPYIGLWEGDDDNGPLFRGSTQGKYLDELFDFIKDYGDDAISFAVFESRGDKGKRRSNRDDDRDNDRDRDRDDHRSSRHRDKDRDDGENKGRRSSRKNDDDDDDPKENRSRRESSRESGKSEKRGKKDWWAD